MKKPIELKKDTYTLQINYSDEAIEKKLMKFITPNGDEFEISADEMGTILSSQINSETLEAIFVESDRVNVVEVNRQIECTLTEDKKKGDVIRIEYRHPLPIELALIEEVWKIANINKDAPAFLLTKEYIDEVIEKMKPKRKENERFLSSFYKSFKGLKIP